jgi:hypothetical protein
MLLLLLLLLELGPTYCSVHLHLQLSLLLLEQGYLRQSSLHLGLQLAQFFRSALAWHRAEGKKTGTSQRW